MKNKITCLLAGAALFGATANAEIVLTDDLSAYGYIDMALTDGEGDGNTDTSVAEFELGFAFTPAEGAWSSVAELSFGSSDVEWETVTISYQYSDTLSFTIGLIPASVNFDYTLFKIGHNNSDATGGTRTVCKREIRYTEERKTIYSHSTVTFTHQGKSYTLRFQK